MYENYLTEENITLKADEWLANLSTRSSRLKKFKFLPKKSALLVIDMQDFFLNKESHAFIPSAITIIKNINSIITEYRNQNLPIIFTYHAYDEGEEPGIMGRWWGDMLRDTDPLSKIHSSIDYNKNDTTIQKKRYSAFIGTNLDQILKDKKIDTLVIVGIMTHLCCESTAREAFMKDYEVYFVVDATATDFEDLHISSIKTLNDGFVRPVKADYIFKEVKQFA